MSVRRLAQSLKTQGRQRVLAVRIHHIGLDDSIGCEEIGLGIDICHTHFRSHPQSTLSILHHREDIYRLKRPAVLVGPLVALIGHIVRYIRQSPLMIQQHQPTGLVRTRYPYIVGIAVVQHQITRYLIGHRLTVDHYRQTIILLALFDDNRVRHRTCIAEPQPVVCIIVCTS